MKEYQTVLVPAEQPAKPPPPPPAPPVVRKKEVAPPAPPIRKYANRHPTDEEIKKFIQENKEAVPKKGHYDPLIPLVIREFVIGYNKAKAFVEEARAERGP